MTGYAVAPAARWRVEVTRVPIDGIETRLAELTPDELRRCSAFRVPKRRREWLAGRMAAKDAVRLRHPSGTVEIQSVEAGPARGRPFYTIDGHEGPYGLSLAHAAGVAVAALAPCAGERIGIDLEPVFERDESFEGVAFSRREIAALRAIGREERAGAATAAWVLKECLLKAIGTGLRVPLTQIEVRPAALRWRGELDGRLSGWFEVAAPVREWIGGDPEFSASVIEAGDTILSWMVLPPRGVVART